MKNRSILLDILIIMLLISIIPLILSNIFNLSSTNRITKELIDQNKDTLLANLQETQVSRVKSLAKEITLILNNYVSLLGKTHNMVAGLPQAAIRQTLTNMNADADYRFSLVSEREINDQVAADLRRHGVAIDLAKVTQTGDDVHILICFYQHLEQSGRGGSALRLCANLYQPLRMIFSQDIRKGSVFIVDKNGFPVYHTKRDTMLKRTFLGDLNIVKSALKGVGFGTMRYTSETNELMFGAFANLSLYNLNWGIVAHSPLKNALFYIKEMENKNKGQIEKIVYISFMILAVTVLLVIILSYLLARRIAYPIRIFDKQARSITRGDYSTRIKIHSKTEIGSLAESFNVMTLKIKDYIERLEKAAKDNEELFYESITALASSIDAKDPYTKGHSERVTNYSVAIAREMGLKEQVITKVRIAALLHDVGKIGVSDSVLQKPGKLSDEEFEEMKRHPIFGANIMGSIKKLVDIIPGMKYHHERFDGSGYPDGIKGDLIPLEAKIIAVADTYDAMTTDRPYQKRMNPRFVAKKILSWAGTRYDPKVVKGFVVAYKRGLLTVK